MRQQEPEERVSERRASTRFRIQAPAVATFGSHEIWAFTRDISARAVYFTATGEEDIPAIGQLLEFVIKIPPSMNLSKPCFIKGRGRMIRLDILAGYESGLVVEILEYDIDSETVHDYLDGETSPES